MDTKSLDDYFAKLSLEGIELTEGQKRWYAKTYDLLKEDTTREYPSTPREAFQSSKEGYWYATQLKELYDNGRVTEVTYDRTIPVNTSFDLGQNDSTAIWFFQINKQGDIRVIDCFQRSDTSLELIAQMLTAKGYTYGTHLWPFDANSRDRAGITFVQQAREFNLTGLVLERAGLLDGINIVRTTLSKMWFDSIKCKEGLAALAAYKKRWNTSLGGFTSDPVHDEASHFSDSLRYLCQGYKFVCSNSSTEDEMKALRYYFG